MHSPEATRAMCAMHEQPQPITSTAALPGGFQSIDGDRPSK